MIAGGAGSIEAIIGSMYGGKTTELMRIARHCVIGGMHICFIIPGSDNRYVKSTVPLNKSHDGLSMKVIRATDLLEDPPGCDASVQAIFIDEGQFFAHLADFCLRHKRRGAQVYFAGLTSDFLGKPWGPIHELVPAHVDKLTLKPGVCGFCQKDAMYTRKIAGDMTKQVDVGGDAMYMPTCLLHLTEPVAVDSGVLAKRQESVQRVKLLISAE